jgi:hypothetical protein
MSRGWRLLIMALGGLLLGATSSARAGIYNLEEPPWSLQPPYKMVRQPAKPEDVSDQIAKIITIDDNVTRDMEARKREPTPLRTAYVNLEQDLRKRMKTRPLTTAETVSLTACLLRMGRYGEAFGILEKAVANCPPTDPGRFLLLLHQAVAYDQNPELKQRALDLQELALKSWPSAWTGWSKEELDWYYRAEKYQWELMKVRQRQAFPGPIGEQRRATVDALFPRVHYVGLTAIKNDALSIATAWSLAAEPQPGAAGPAASVAGSVAALIVAGNTTGGYEAGGIAPSQMAELPVEAEALVVQLLLWHPGDLRLRWLYGELLNTRGDVADALDQLTRCRDQRLDAVELHRHRQILNQAPRGPQSTPDKENLVPFATPSSQGMALPDWQVLGTGVFIGVFLTLIGVFQVQLWQRRRGRLPQQ